MLDEYFSLAITDEGSIESLPLLAPGYTPNLSKLPLCECALVFALVHALTAATLCLRAVLLRLGVQVDWTTEKPCFESFLRELAYFYTPGPVPLVADSNRSDEAQATETRLVQHVVFPIAKQYLVPPASLLKKDVVLATSLESLFKVFERC